MPRRSVQILISCLVVSALLLGARTHASFADDEEAPQGADPQAEATAPKTIEWVMGWAAGRARAKADGKIIFLYFGRHKPG